MKYVDNWRWKGKEGRLYAALQMFPLTWWRWKRMKGSSFAKFKDWWRCEKWRFVRLWRLVRK